MRAAQRSLLVLLLVVCGFLGLFTLAVGAKTDSRLTIASAAASGVVLLWFALFLVAMLYRAARAGHALRVAADGIEMPGWPRIAWRHVHGARVNAIDVKGSKNLQLWLLLGNAAELKARSFVRRRLLGPTDAAPRGSDELGLAGVLFDIDEQQLRSAVRSLALRHAPRFDAFWYRGKPLAQALRSADESKSAVAHQVELKSAGDALMALARSGRTETDPEILAAKERLDAAFARSKSDVADAVAHGKALQSEAAVAMRQAKLWGTAALLAVLAVLAIRAAVWYFGAR